MTKQIQNADSAERLRNQYGLKGRVQVSLDELIVPTADVGDFAGKSPFERNSRIQGGDTAVMVASGAARYGYVCITPGPGTLLVVEGIVLSYPTASHRVELRLMTPANVQGTTTGTISTYAWNRPIFPAALLERMVATTRTIHHTAITGARIASYLTSTLHNAAVDLGRGVVLDGTDPVGPLSLGIWTTSLNTQTPYINWVGSEYKVR